MVEEESAVSPCMRNNEGEERGSATRSFVLYPKSVGELNQRKEEEELHALHRWKKRQDEVSR